jgi:hypothetical protein
MKGFTSYLFVALFTFAISVFGTMIFFYQPLKVEKSENSVTFAETKVESKQNLTNNEPLRQTELKSLSPYDIESYIYNNPQSDINNVWQKLNISEKFNSLPNWEKNESFLGVCNSCEAETFQYNLDDEPGDEVLLRIADNSQESCRYLLFKHINSENDSWKLLGFIDHDFGRYQMPQHSFLLSGGKSFLVVQVQTQSGTGVAHYTDRLFAVHKEKLIELLDYPADGHQSLLAYQGNREFSGRVSDCKIENGKAQIEIEFRVNYSGWDGKTNSDFLLWNKIQKAVYTKSLNSKRKKLDSSKSDITQEEIDTIYNIDSSTDEDVLKYNFEQLKTIARKKGAANQWLREFLRYCKSSKEKRELEKIIRK